MLDFQFENWIHDCVKEGELTPEDLQEILTNDSYARCMFDCYWQGYDNQEKVDYIRVVVGEYISRNRRNK